MDRRSRCYVVDAALLATDLPRYDDRTVDGAPASA